MRGSEKLLDVCGEFPRVLHDGIPSLREEDCRGSLADDCRRGGRVVAYRSVLTPNGTQERPGCSRNLGAVVKTTLASAGDEEPDDETWALVSKALEPMQAQAAKVAASMGPSLAGITAITEQISKQMASIVTAPMHAQLRKLSADMAAAMPKLDLSSMWAGHFALPVGFADAIAVANQNTLQAFARSIQFSAADWVGLQAFLDGASDQLAHGDVDATTGAHEWLPDGISVEWLQRFGLFLLLLAFSLPMLLPAASAHHFRELQEQLFKVGSAVAVAASWVSKAK